MTRLTRSQLKGVVGTAIAGGGVAGLLAGVVLGAAAVLAPGAVPLAIAVGGVTAMGAFGAFTTGGVATMLAMSRATDSIEELSVLKCGAMGLLTGGAFPAFAALLTGGFLFPFELGALAWAGTWFGVLGSGIAAGIVAVAKDAPSGELEAARPAALISRDST